jgi:hypothetical protein
MLMELNKISGSELNLKFGGKLDERSELPDIKDQAKELTKICIDLNDLEHINSVGILKWKKWQEEIRNVNPNCEVHLIGCRKYFIDIVNIFEGMLMPNTRIDSFYIPFYCEDCDTFDECVIDSAKNVSSPSDDMYEISVAPAICPECSKEMEAEVAIMKYLTFLGRFGPTELKKKST